jgi:multiple sugar transport system substrate-binding protein
MAAQEEQNQSQTGPQPVSQGPAPSLPPLEPVGQASPPGVPQPQPPSPQGGQRKEQGPQIQQPPPPKRSFPKKLIFILGGIILLGAIGFFAYRYFGSGFGGMGKTTITWWGLWEDESIVNPIIEEYESANPGVEITYINQSQQDYRERLTNALSREGSPDIFRFHNTWVPMLRQNLDSIPASVMSSADFAKTFYPIASSDLSTGSGIVGIPLEYDAITLFINEDIFQQNNKIPPETWDDLRQTAIELTVKDERDVITQAGVALGRTENIDHWPEILGLMMLQNGANPANPTSKLAEDALNFFTVFSRQDGVWDETMPPSTAAFAAGKVAMYFAPSWRAFEIERQNPNLKYKTVDLPQLPKTTSSEPDVAYATFWIEGVNAASTNTEEAWKFLSYLSQKETLQKLYQNQSRVRAFGEPYPRVDMADLLSDHPIVGSIIDLAPDAESWYLGSRTFDGPTGINSQLADYYADAIKAVNEGVDASKALETAAQGVSQVLSQYQVQR